MIDKSVQDILPCVSGPSRYLGTEINAVRKPPGTVRLRFALAFPDLYEIGTSHFGMQILYHILNRHPDIAAERVFAPAPDMEAALREAHLPMASLETATPLARFDIIGFSLLYELNYTNILTMLDLAGIPFRASDRNGGHPLIIAGGPCACNPEPVADFFDAMVIGEGEDVIQEMTRIWLEWSGSSPGDREGLLRAWAGIRGVYVPGFFHPSGDEAAEGPRLIPKYSDYVTIQRAIVNDLDAAPFPEAPVMPFGKPVHDRLRIEIARGCARGCRFCQAGMIYRPVRERSPEALLDLADRCLGQTGYEDLSLLSLSAGDYANIAPLMTRLMARCAADRVAVSLPSLRAGTLTPELMELIRRVRKTGFTIAPEAGTQRLRDVINKNIAEADIMDTVGAAFEMGWRVIKLYFMIGLPTETMEDLAGIVDLVNRLRKLRGPGGGRPNINVSVGAFIPKPHAPFQWAAQLDAAQAMERINWLRDRLRMPGVRLKWQSPDISRLEGLFARGDRSLSRLLEAAYRAGCRLDGWSDHFRADRWAAALAETGIDADAEVSRSRPLDAPLPWDHIRIVSKDFLREEWERAFAGRLTPDCSLGECQGCGVCDFKTLAPLRHPPMASAPAEMGAARAEVGSLSGGPGGGSPAAGGSAGVSPGSGGPGGGSPAAGGSAGDGGDFKKLRVHYEKLGPARFFGHLEMVNLLTRALRRAGAPMKYSQGFHPMPKVAFDDPLPLGMESHDEIFDIAVARRWASEDLAEKVNPGLPEGLRIVAVGPAPGGAPQTDRHTLYEIRSPEDLPFDKAMADAFLALESAVIERTNRKGKLKKFDLRAMIQLLEWRSPGYLRLCLEQGPGRMVRPAEALMQIFGFDAASAGRVRVIKLESHVQAVGHQRQRS